MNVRDINEVVLVAVKINDIVKVRAALHGLEYKIGWTGDMDHELSLLEDMGLNASERANSTRQAIEDYESSYQSSDYDESSC